MGVLLEPGVVIAGRYRLLRLLGQGGMGSVWAAAHTVTRRQVAMKFVRGSSHARPGLRQRLLREGRAASVVRHPNVVDVIDVFELDEETPVMVMDLLSGETLGARIEREERLSLRETADILLPTVSAIGTAHTRGIVHRDLKPDNIFLADERGTVTVKVLDFGIAKLTEHDGVSPEGKGATTQAGFTLGTPCYMAPEQAVAESDLDHRVDIWALGAIVYECLSGIRPIDGDTVGQVVMRLMSTGITPLERLVLDLPADVADLVARMLSRERRRRPDDLREVLDVFRRYSEVAVPDFGAPGSELDLTLRAEPPAPLAISLAPAPLGRRRARAVVLLGVPLAATLGLGAWYGNRPSAPAQALLLRAIAVPRAAPEPPATASTAIAAVERPSAVEAPSASRVADPVSIESAAVGARRSPEPSARPATRKPPPAAAAAASEKDPPQSEPAPPRHLKGLADTPPF